MRTATILLLTLCSICATLAGDPETGTLSVLVKIRGAEGGSVEMALVDSQAALEGQEEPLRSATVELDGSTARWQFEGVPYGDYALKAYLDRDRSGTMERNLLGIPVEPYGFSNNARGRFGPPDWEQARFAIGAPETKIVVKLK